MKTGVKKPDKTSSLEEAVKELENKLEVSINIHTNEILIEGESLDVMKAKDIIEALDLGFSNNKAFKLFKEGNQLKVVELKEHFSSRKSIDRIKARIIGTDGKTRKLIEEYSGALISIHGDRVSIIGNYQEVSVASNAVEMFINGSKHARVYEYLEQNQPQT